ncbi:uncharacterized protein LOC128554851 [Mercenaria mercenaria]|uniref:uncharacterized protein LOC128554851 n=1 Tax=Mercenaria mercenaria TaxID=6596 RepID=UPI00234EF14F|nr:uncharacterized protein LOC128554851 [Mercenaria mercenaria]
MFSHRLRRKLLEKDDPILDQCKQIALAMEASESQASALGHPTVNDNEQVNNVSASVKFKKRPTQQKYEKKRCFACGYDGHIRTDPKCPARGKKCRKCKHEGHFEKCCKTPSAKQKLAKRRDIRTVNLNADSADSDSDYLFVVSEDASTTSNNEDILVNIGRVTVPVIIDSGASVNVVDREVWGKLKANKVKCKSKLTNKKVFAYGHTKPLTVAVCFTANVSVNHRNTETEFFVIEEKGKALLSKTLQLNWGFLLRRVPYGLREKLGKEFHVHRHNLEKLDIIEKVDSPSKWVSPVVVVPKKEGVRLCVDMRRANEAVIRERYPIPTTEEVLQDLNNSAVFSKLDIKMAYHQIELDEESREITRFMTHKGMYRYKRRMFGISCAPEIYNKVRSQVLSGLQGVNSIFDDIMVHGKDTAEHNVRLKLLLTRLQEKGLTLNLQKCQFNMSHIDFMGVVLSQHGVGLADDKVEAVLEAREPRNVSEVKSFLTLVNFSSALYQIWLWLQNL